MAFSMSLASTSASTLRATPLSAARPAPRAATGRGALQVAAGLKSGVGVFGEKAGMTQVFTEDGKVLPVTVISIADGNFITMVRARSIATPRVSPVRSARVHTSRVHVPFTCHPHEGLRGS
jgi:hypothetical protein